jgi:hypothetical protein
LSLSSCVSCAPACVRRTTGETGDGGDNGGDACTCEDSLDPASASVSCRVHNTSCRLQPSQAERRGDLHSGNGGSTECAFDPKADGLRIRILANLLQRSQRILH